VERLHDATSKEEACLQPPCQYRRLDSPRSATDLAGWARSRARLRLYEPAAAADASAAFLALASRTWRPRQICGLRQQRSLLPQEAVERVVGFLLRARRDAITLALRASTHSSTWEWPLDTLPSLVRHLLQAGAQADHRPRSYNGNLVGRPVQAAILLEDCLFPSRSPSAARFYRCLPENVLRDVVQMLIDGGARADAKVEWCPGIAPEFDTDLLGLLCVFGKYLSIGVFTELFDLLLRAGGDLNGSVRCFLRYYHHDDSAYAKLRVIFSRVLEHVKGTLESRSRPSASDAVMLCPEMMAEVEELIRSKRARIGP